MPAILKNKAFLSACVDAIPLILKAVLDQFWPGKQEFIMTIWYAFQPVALGFIGYYAVDTIGKSEVVKSFLMAIKK